jgi:YHS domain-containing protein
MLRLALILLLMILIARAFWRVVDGVIAGATGRRPLSSKRSNGAVHMERDPVCGTYVVADRAVVLADGSVRRYFCSTACRDKYRARTA